MNPDLDQTNRNSDYFYDKHPLNARRRFISKKEAPGPVFGTFFAMAFISVVVSLPLWYFTNSANASMTLCVCITAVSIWYIYCNAKIYGGLTFSSFFVAVSAFVFVARGLYVSIYNDFGILDQFGLPAEHRIITRALVCVLYGTLAFIFGALLLERRTMQAHKESLVQEKIALSLAPPDLSVILFIIQVIFFFILLPYGKAHERASLANTSGNAYVYLLPTLIHGFNLYIFAYFVSAWWRGKTLSHLFMLVGSGLLMLAHAYCMYNMSNFRGFYLVGLFTAGIVFLIARFGKVPVVFLVLIFTLYPLFKNIGSDRTLSNSEMVSNVLLAPQNSYNADGMDRAFGDTTDLNMLDTLAASLNYEHQFHPYILSDLYVFVHWVPRSVWPGKPAYGITDDVNYLRGLPFSPGIIGFLNDDGGKIYMIILMGMLGALLKWCEVLTFRIQWFEFYLCTWAAFFLTALVTFRSLPYMDFYGFLVFFMPAFILNWMVRVITGTGVSGKLLQKNNLKENSLIVS